MEDRKTQDAAAVAPAVRAVPDWRARAAFLRLQAILWEQAALSAENGYSDYGPVGPDFGQRIAVRLRECAREAVWTARELDVYAEEEPCQQDTEDVGRTDDAWPQSLTIVRGGAA